MPVAARRPVLVALAALAAWTAAPTPALAQAPAPQRVDALAWMAGCWARTTSSGVIEEVWLPPLGGATLGLSRTVRDGVAVAHEHLLLHEVDGAVVYRASPSGQATAEFVASHVSDSLAVFENPEHDFPRRIVYRPAAGDSLHARIEGPGPGGTVRGVDFRFGRGRCPG